MQTIRERNALKSAVGRQYNHNPDHYRFARTCPGFHPDDDTPDWIAPVTLLCVIVIFSVLYAIGVNL